MSDQDVEIQNDDVIKTAESGSAVPAEKNPPNPLYKGELTPSVAPASPPEKTDDNSGGTPEPLVEAASRRLLSAETPEPRIAEPQAAGDLSPEVALFLNEFAHNGARRKVLLDAIENKTPVAGGKYFQARFKEVCGL